METVMSLDSISPQSSPTGEIVIVGMDGNRGKGSLDALEWAIKYIVSPNDTVVVLGVLPEIGKKPNPSCLPFHLGIGSSSIYLVEKLLNYCNALEELEILECATDVEPPSVLTSKIKKLTYGCLMSEFPVPLDEDAFGLLDGILLSCFPRLESTDCIHT